MRIRVIGIQLEISELLSRLVMTNHDSSGTAANLSCGKVLPVVLTSQKGCGLWLSPSGS